MTIALRSLFLVLRQMPAASRANAASAARYRWFSKAPTESKNGVATPIEILQTNAPDGDLHPPDRVKLDICGDVEVEDEEEMEEMVQEGPAGKEWGGPTRGGVLSEPTRFGDWERKGRCSDF